MCHVCCVCVHACMHACVCVCIGDVLIMSLCFLGCLSQCMCGRCPVSFMSLYFLSCLSQCMCGMSCFIYVLLKLSFTVHVWEMLSFMSLYFLSCLSQCMCGRCPVSFMSLYFLSCLSQCMCGRCPVSFMSLYFLSCLSQCMCTCVWHPVYVTLLLTLFFTAYVWLRPCLCYLAFCVVVFCNTKKFWGRTQKNKSWGCGCYIKVTMWPACDPWVLEDLSFLPNRKDWQWSGQVWYQEERRIVKNSTYSITFNITCMVILVLLDSRWKFPFVILSVSNSVDYRHKSSVININTAMYQNHLATDKLHIGHFLDHKRNDKKKGEKSPPIHHPSTNPPKQFLNTF